MKRTSPTMLVLVGLLGVVAGFLLDHGLTSASRPTFTPTVSLPILLVVLGVLVLVLAVPIARATRGTSTARVNPFRAMRVAVLAKASSILGSLAAGFGAGLGAYLLTRPVAPPVGSLGLVIATAVAGLLLVAAALVAEHLCTIRKDDDDEHAGSPTGSYPGR